MAEVEGGRGEIDCWSRLLRRGNTINFETDELSRLLCSDRVIDPRRTAEITEAKVGLPVRRDRLSAETAEPRQNYRPAMNCRDYVYCGP